MAEGEFGESPRLKGEDYPYITTLGPQFILPYDLPIVEKKLTFEEASKCLNTLGKDESGIRYAYLMITATDRKLTDVSVVLNFKHVLFLDFSGNFLNLEALNVLGNMPFLILLKVNRNLVESAGLDAMPYLQVLCLNVNKIGDTSDIAQPMLETLELEFNQIFTAQFDSEKLPSLKELDLKGNHLSDLSGSYPESLERLFMAQNQITRLNHLAFSRFSNLTTLHLRDNKIRKLNGFTESLAKLSYLNLRDNNVMKLRQFRKLGCLPKLETLIYIGNPVAGPIKGVVLPGEGASEDAEEEEEEEEAYGEDGPVKEAFDPVRIGVLVLLPKLKRINKDLVGLQERDEAFLIKEKKLEQIMDEASSEEETEPPTTTYTSEIGGSETDDQEMTFDPRPNVTPASRTEEEEEDD